MQKNKLVIMRCALIFFLFLIPVACLASDLDQQLYQTAIPYIKYFSDRSLDSASGFNGLTRSYQIDLGGHTSVEQNDINYGASAYDQSILARIGLANGITTILDTYISYFNQLSDPNNPLLNCNGNYTDANGNPILYGPYMTLRILGRSVPSWWDTWNWSTDTGAAACLIVDTLEAYQKTQNNNYKNFAILLGGYILKLQDGDGGIRWGPIGIYHDQGLDFYWKTKSTEQNERALYAFQALRQVTGDTQYDQVISNIKSWLKQMYNPSVHLYHTAATFIAGAWVKTDFGYVATDVTAFAPLELMFQDTYFGSTQALRNAEIDAMFAAIESRTAFLDGQAMPKLFRFSVSQNGDYGSVEWSSQMALAYLRTAQIYSASGEAAKADEYLKKYNSLVLSLGNYFVAPAADPNARVASYASYLNGSVAGHVPTGTGYFTYNCQAALASAYYAFAKAGYIPYILGGGTGIPQTYSTLNMSGVPWYQNTAYNSTGAAAAEMILNYIREGAGQPLLNQTEIYQYARSPEGFGPELIPAEIDKVLGHFDPYDYLVSNQNDYYDSLPGGNPRQGYNFGVEAFDPNADANALNKYMRDICHWMAYTVTKEDWWLNGELVAHPNTPAVIPLYGTYNHWAIVKGYAVSTNPCPEPHTNPFNTPDFTVYGFWIKDPLINGIGKDTYKTAVECQLTYFLPVSSTDNYNGKFIQVAEPPAQISQANVKILQPAKDIANLGFIGAATEKQRSTANFAMDLAKKQGWRGLVDTRILSDPEAVAAFRGTKMDKPILVQRTDLANSNYYLVPFNKLDENGRYLTSAVIIIDANYGYFREASWTEKPEVLFNVTRGKAINLLKRFILKDFQNNPTFEYKKIISNIGNAKIKLIWRVNGYSPSPYKPYWKINVNGHIWFVTQEGKVITLK